jgi:death-on-curing protein
VKWLSVEQVVTMHAELLDRYGGEEGGGHRGSAYEGAEAAVQAVKNSYYEDLVQLGAAYAVYIVEGHVFMDGNKRAGYAAMTTFFQLNGVKIWADPERIQELMIELQQRIERGQGGDGLVHWLADMLMGGESD